ncbi:N-acetylglucosamine kinase-like BadF-type ATPase [Microbacterium keratanolyticum]|uniref:ATPase BadF/BadG/BcrA/BcrD type domain-containing protein n=1 Tax=Microbacterium keratanolyticum TaxID=67574 RepID=A0A9W6HUI4_9MICO|nr:BadF/BadG/BcrA/BcrD ATPase family protein [Microbacterium keratanolyticum]MBM7467892.1 N-acetylglucosamine kinase-like BadF-type ATPase [Microbacterium keratanolyticum]GLK02883.1 hypothetical protein GCM10017596_25980 [Microbacterium keratanolyticum]
MRVLGIDIGGSGSRLALRESSTEPRDEREGPATRITAAGAAVDAVALAALRTAAEAWPTQIREVSAIGIGASGLGTLVADHAKLLTGLRDEARTLGFSASFAAEPTVVMAIDAVTAHLGALDGASGAIVALGTGAIALGGDGHALWHRVDGWGHLLGDRGGGAEIGMQGLRAALRAFDGIDPANTALLTAARARFGEPAAWPGLLYTRDDRAGVLASFAADVAALGAHDAVAHEILATAGADAARSAIAALVPGIAPRIALTGGIARSSIVTGSFADTVTALRPDVAQVSPAGDPLHGALLLAERAATGALEARPDYVWI